MTVQDRPTRNLRRGLAAPERTVELLQGWSLPRVKALGGAALAGALACGVTWLLIAVPVLVAWFADPLSTVSAWQALGSAAAVWALTHRGVVDAAEVSLQLTPLMLTALPVLLCRYAARHVLTDDEASVSPKRIGGFRAAWHGVRGNDLTSFVVGYGALGLVICLASGLGASPASFWLALPGLLLVPVTGITLALIREHRREENPTIARALRWIAHRIPVLARRGLKPAGEALAALTAGSVLVLAALVAFRVERIGTLYQALDAGPVGVVVLTLGQLLLLPNMVLWALGWIVGAGMAIGPVQVGWMQTTSADLPLIPVLGALPEPGLLPAGTWAVVLFPTLIGAWLGFRSAWSAPRLASWWTKARVAASACAWVGAAVLALSWLARGSLTPGLLGTIGTAPLVVTGALLAELLVGAIVAVTAIHMTRRSL
ncbi:MAG: DUF6350 family protein [Ornithinimicrobium sp.]